MLIFASLHSASSATVPIVDSLGAATTDTQFSFLQFSLSGQAIDSTQNIGAKFTLTQPTTLTEIGGFVNNCRIIANFIPQCPETLPFIVQIRPANNGVPDASTVLASFELSHDNDPLVVSYESAGINILLQPGTYFALFAPQGTDAGDLLGSAIGSFSYQADVIDLGVLNTITGAASVHHVPAAIRILGETNVVIDGCDSGVPLMTLPGGFTISDLISECAENATNHGQFVSCVAHVTDNQKKAGTLTAQQRSSIQSCAVHADIP